MRTNTPFPVRARARALAPAALLLATLAGCAGSEGGTSSRFVRCDAPGPAIATAVDRYIKNVQPRPRRFVIPVGGGTDSLPEPGRQTLQNAGPTFLWPADSAQQAVVREKLLTSGSYATLLVALRDVALPDDSSAVVRLGGRFVGAPADERDAPTMTVSLRCRGGTWALDRVEPERAL